MTVTVLGCWLIVESRIKAEPPRTGLQTAKDIFSKFECCSVVDYLESYCDIFASTALGCDQNHPQSCYFKAKFVLESIMDTDMSKSSSAEKISTEQV